MPNAWRSSRQIPPPRPPAAAKSTTSICEPHREFIEAQLRAKRNYTAIYQDLVDSHGFTGAYNSVKRFCGGLCKHEPEQFDRLEFAPGEEAQVDYGAIAHYFIYGADEGRLAYDSAGIAIEQAILIGTSG
jgi:hypothetical protein